MIDSIPLCMVDKEEFQVKEIMPSQEVVEINLRQSGGRVHLTEAYIADHCRIVSKETPSMKEIIYVPYLKAYCAKRGESPIDDIHVPSMYQYDVLEEF